MVDWSNDDILHFLECFEAEPCIWNPQDKCHKDKKKVADAWIRLSETLNTSVKELKKKKDILMITWRRHFNRKLNSINSGTGDIYEPVWFAYQPMERFLLPVYSNKHNITIEMQPSVTLEEVLEEVPTNSSETTENPTLVPDDNNNRTPPRPSPVSLASKPRARRRPTPDVAEKKICPITSPMIQMSTPISQITSPYSQMKSPFNHMTTPFSPITNISSSYIERQTPPSRYDECDIYASLLARKLRDLTDDERKVFMYEIDGLFVERVYKKRCTQDISLS